MNQDDSDEVRGEGFLSDESDEQETNESDEQETNEEAADREFWRQKFEEYRAELFYYACRLSGGKVEQAKDAMQWASCRLQKCRKKRADVVSPKAYLFTIVRNAFEDLRKKEKDLISIDDPDFSPEQVEQLVVDPKTQQILENKELLDHLGQGLKSPDNEICRLIREDRSAAEIGKLCGMTIPDVRKAKARILYHLKNEFRKSQRRAPNVEIPDIKRTGKPPQKSNAPLAHRIRKRR